MIISASLRDFKPRGGFIGNAKKYYYERSSTPAPGYLQEIIE